MMTLDQITLRVAKLVDPCAFDDLPDDLPPTERSIMQSDQARRHKSATITANLIVDLVRRELHHEP